MSKRANKEGTISKRSDNRWEIKYYDNDDKRRTAYAKTQAEAREKLKELKNKVDSGVNIAKSGTLFVEWLKTWLENYAKPSVKHSTYISYYTYIFKHIEPTFPKISLKDLQPEHLQRFLVQKLKSGRLDGTSGGLSNNTVHKMKVMIGTALRQAIHNGMANRNIADMVKLPNVLQQEMRVLDLKEQNKLEDTCLKSNDLAAFGIYLSLNTGMRLGEILGLTWENIDLKKGIISVKQTLNRLMVFNKETKTEIEIGTPKSKTSRREIPLFDDCSLKLMEYKKRQDEHIKKLNGAFKNLGFVFTTPLGKYIEPKTFQDLFKRQIKAAGIKDANFHAMRHTFATRSLEAGMDIYVLSRILGHAQASTTLNKYGHALPDHKKSSMDKLEQYRKKTS